MTDPALQELLTDPVCDPADPAGRAKTEGTQTSRRRARLRAQHRATEHHERPLRSCPLCFPTSARAAHVAGAHARRPSPRCRECVSPDPPEAPPQASRPACPKERWHTKEAAEEVLRHLRGRAVREPWRTETRVYFHRVCGGYHLTSQEQYGQEPDVTTVDAVAWAATLAVAAPPAPPVLRPAPRPVLTPLERAQAHGAHQTAQLLAVRDALFGLAAAVERHQQAAGDDPAPADRELWAVLDGPMLPPGGDESTLSLRAWLAVRRAARQRKGLPPYVVMTEDWEAE